jgi:PX domain-containing protein kinase-like protein
VVREFVSNGSLKDAIYGKNPRGTALSKYGQAASMRRLTPSNIKLYGRQILEALNFLSERGFVMGRCTDHTRVWFMHGHASADLPP